MGPGHEKLNVYHLSMGYVAWVYGMMAMLGRLDGRACSVSEDPGTYSVVHLDFDTDPDFDLD
jgi:hypothetical protein